MLSAWRRVSVRPCHAQPLTLPSRDPNLQVDDSGKVTRLRKECPGEECGAGTFMANHYDRHYCGKCGLTYAFQK